MEDLSHKDLSNQPGPSLLRTQVYEYLRRELKEENLKPGMSVSMSELITHLGISRTPLRDALLQLQNEGFVTFLPQRGIRINKLTQSDIENMYEMLGALDSRILLAVFDRIGSAEIEQMKQINSEMGKNLEKRNFPRYWNLNTALHNVYLSLSTNQLILNHINILRQRLFEFGKKDWSLRRKHVIHKEHLTLIALIEKGDAVTAADFMRDQHTILDLDAKIINSP
jgi:DNA-binding GntR family transcriptional regulator